MPTAKVTAGALAGALATLVVIALGAGGYDLPAEGATAVATILTFIVSWLVPDASTQG